jgi:hypothetical protein
MSFDQWRKLHVAQLADIEVPAFRPCGPAEEQVRGGLHQPLAHHHALAVVRESDAPGIGFQYGRVGLLELKKKRMVPDRHHQGHHAHCPDAADADDFDRRIRQPVAIEQDTTILGQRFAIWCETLADHFQVASGARC